MWDLPSKDYRSSLSFLDDILSQLVCSALGGVPFGYLRPDNSKVTVQFKSVFLNTFEELERF